MKVKALSVLSKGIMPASRADSIVSAAGWDLGIVNSDGLILKI